MLPEETGSLGACASVSNKIQNPESKWRLSVAQLALLVCFSWPPTCNPLPAKSFPHSSASGRSSSKPSQGAPSSSSRYFEISAPDPFLLHQGRRPRLIPSCSISIQSSESEPCKFFVLFWLIQRRRPALAVASEPATMSKTGALDLASGLGGKIDKEQVKSAVDEYVSLSLPCRWRDPFQHTYFLLFRGAR